MGADMCRINRGQVHRVGSAVIEDRGFLRRASRASDGSYLFSEVGAGVQELVLLGTPQGILVWLAEHYDSKIKNIIPELPNIYMGIEQYKPGARFVGLFPLHDAIAAVTTQAVGIGGAVAGAFMPEMTTAFGRAAQATTSIVGGIGDAKGALQTKANSGFTTSAKKVKVTEQQLYIKFSYIEQSKMHLVSGSELDFRRLRKIIKMLLN